MYRDGMSLFILAALALSPTAFTRSIKLRSIDPPEGCPLPKWTVSTFKWFNSSHNLNCFTGPDLQKTGCITDSHPAAWCHGKEPGCTDCSIPLCSTGLPSQPIGYGPPDTLQIEVEGVVQCSDTNPKSYRRHDLGNGAVECGTAARVMEFYGSTEESRNKGRIVFHPVNNPYHCNNGSIIQYSGSAEFSYACTHDNERNATCTADPFNIPIQSWRVVR